MTDVPREHRCDCIWSPVSAPDERGNVSVTLDRPCAFHKRWYDEFRSALDDVHDLAKGPCQDCGCQDCVCRPRPQGRAD